MDLRVIYAIEKILVLETMREVDVVRILTGSNLKSEIGLEDETISSQAEIIIKTEKEFANASNR